MVLIAKPYGLSGLKKMELKPCAIYSSIISVPLLRLAFVVVINADKVRMTGNKVEQKVYYSHSGYPGGLKEVPAKRLRVNKADWMIREAVLGMLPKNKLRARRAKKLRIYRDAAGLARHAGQKPQPMAL